MTFSVFGTRVYTSEINTRKPRYVFDPQRKVPLFEDARADHERWCMEFFGWDYVAYKLQNPVNGEHIIVMHPVMLEELKRQGVVDAGTLQG